MTKFKRQGFRNTFKNARKGFRLTVKSERNIRIHIFAGILVLISAYSLHFSITKFAILFITITSVIVSEMFNSAIEFSLDAIFHNRYSKMVGMAKDISAGAVMVATINAILVGALLFVPAVISALK